MWIKDRPRAAVWLPAGQAPTPARGRRLAGTAGVVTSMRPGGLTHEDPAGGSLVVESRARAQPARARSPTVGAVVAQHGLGPGSIPRHGRLHCAARGGRSRGCHPQPRHRVRLQPVPGLPLAAVGTADARCRARCVDTAAPVSYTHLTLPTIYSV